MNLLLVLALVLYPTLAAVVGREIPWLGAVILGVSVLHALGMVALATGRRKLGFVLAAIAGGALVPLGILGLIGARQAIDAAERAEFEGRRRTA